MRPGDANCFCKLCQTNLASGSVLICFLALGLCVVSRVEAYIERQPIPGNLQNTPFMAKLSSTQGSTVKHITICRPPIKVESEPALIYAPNDTVGNCKFRGVDSTLGRQRRDIKTLIAKIRESEVIWKFCFWPNGIGPVNQFPCWSIPGVLYSIAKPPLNVPISINILAVLNIKYREGNIGSLASLNPFPIDSISFLRLPELRSHCFPLVEHDMSFASHFMSLASHLVSLTAVD